MNFLSHYYFDAIPENSYYNIGLSLPDLFGFLKNRIRVNEKLINILKSAIAHTEALALYDGMAAHLKLDKWFHGSAFFKCTIEAFQTSYREKTGFFFPNFTAHIILEMLIDKYILDSHPGIGSDFYTAFRTVDFEKITTYFASVENLDIADLKSVLQRFRVSTYVGEYSDINLIIAISNKVSEKFNTGIRISSIAEYDAISGFYDRIAPEIGKLLQKPLSK